MKILLRLVIGLLTLALMAGVGLTWLFTHYFSDLPDYKYLADYEPAMVTRVHAGDGRLLAEYAAERRVFVPIAAMPKLVVQAFISAEDKNFRDHHGIDPLGILRALLTNVENFKSDRRPVGASTITQQVAKNFLLSGEVSMTRKIKEAILAVRIERALSKERILELYLNEIFLGYRSYGVAAAALNYFNRSLNELSIAEAAYLAALPKAPSNYNPERQYEAAVTRRNWVIGRMQEDGLITRPQAEQAMAEPLVLRKRDETEIFTADYFAEEVRRDLIKLYGEKALYEGGLDVRTSLNPALQEQATSALRRELINYDRHRGWRGPAHHMANFDSWAKKLGSLPFPPGGEGWRLAVVLEAKPGELDLGFPDGSRGKIPLSELRWARAARDEGRLGPEIRKATDVLQLGDVVLVEAVSADERGTALPANTYGLRQIPEVQGGMVVLDPHTGRVLAMVGGFSPKMSSFNRATQALRQPGSAFKPFVYLTALANGFTPSSLVLDAPFSYDPGFGQPVWRPENYSQRFYGPTPLRVGIEKSRNVMTVRLAQAIGMDKVKETAERFGIMDKFQPYLPMSLGAGETTVLRLTTAYAMLDNGGKRIVPSLIDRVQDRNGKTIFRHDDRPCPGCRVAAWQPGLAVPEPPDVREQIADPRHCYQMVSILEGVVQRGTANKLAALGRPLAGKTGTTNDSNDAWFEGFSPNLVAGVYIGYDQPQSLGSHETGGSLAVPVFKNFIEAALKDQPPIPFRIPPGLRLMRVNPETGALVESDNKKAIWEAFIPGTEPEGERQILDGSSGRGGGTSGGESSPVPAATEPTGMGTGGLY